MRRGVYQNSCQSQSGMKQRHLFHQKTLHCQSLFLQKCHLATSAASPLISLASAGLAVATFTSLLAAFQRRWQQSLPSFITAKRKLSSILRRAENALAWSLARWACQSSDSIQRHCRVSSQTPCVNRLIFTLPGDASLCRCRSQYLYGWGKSKNLVSTQPKTY